jgi:integrase
VSATAFRLILLTAQRPGEVFRMHWRDIEDGAWWVIRSHACEEQRRGGSREKGQRE